MWREITTFRVKQMPGKLDIQDSMCFKQWEEYMGKKWDEDNRGIYMVVHLGMVERAERPAGKNGKFKRKGRGWTGCGTQADP